MSERCAMCDVSIMIEEAYVVQIDVFADPRLPDMSAGQIAKSDLDKSWPTLMKALEQYTTQELEEQVFKRFKYLLCGRCRETFMSNPLGRPRTRIEGTN